MSNSTVSWWAKARNRLLLDNVSGLSLLIVYFNVWGYWWRLELLQARLLMVFILTGYAWWVVLATACLWVVSEVLWARLQLRYVGVGLPKQHAWFFVVGLVGFGVLLGVVLLFWREVALTYLYLVLVGVVLPGAWPAYVVYGWWEKKHQKRLIRRGWRLLVAV